jgi:pimeloyl-ACP methyl ester carboxylesterase
MHRDDRNCGRTICALVLGAALFACGAGRSVDASGAREADQPVAPCVSSLEVSACEQWITYGHGPARSRIYSTYKIDAHNPQIKRALILVHGANLMAGYFFRHGTAAADLAGALADTIVISAYFIDPYVGKRHSAGHEWLRQPDEVVWPEGHTSWKAGGMSVSDPALSSFDYVDAIVRKLADKKVFPNLTKIVIAGFSAGGQFVNRYEMANKLDGTLTGVAMSYVVGDPSSFAWPAAVRPLPVGDASPNTPLQAYEESIGKEGTRPHTGFTFGSFDAAKAPTYDDWPYGLQNLNGYVAGMSAERLRRNLVTRSVTYVEGQVDTLPISGFDSSPNAEAQGPQRRARGEAFVMYVDRYLGARQKLVIAPGCSHNSRCVLTADNVLPLLFPPPPGPATYPTGGFGLE